ncbi:hypothetical protein WN48_01515 [Eufriesea mexicana]|nr:hypothetical protein WN48_01515 [Eufriesea mexicana]
MKLLVSTRGPCWAVAGQDRHFASQPHGVELNHPCGLTVDGTSPSASMCPSPSRVRLRQRTAPSRSEDALIRGGHPGTRCMTRLTVTGNECRRRVVRMTYEACTYPVHESTSRRLVAGDVGEENLGLSTTDRFTLIEDVQIVFHCAATLEFVADLKSTTNINLLGTRRVVQLCQEIRDLKALVHISSAYVNSMLNEVEERIYPAPFDVNELLTLVEKLDNDTLLVETPNILKDHPNTYTFTKHLAEHEVQNGRVPAAIVRPSMVTAAWKEPVPGWTTSKNGPQGFLMGASKGVIRRLPIAKNLIYDYIPVDIVVNNLIVAAYAVDQDRYPLQSAVWYPHLKFVSSIFLFKLSAIFVHFIPAYILDTITKLAGGRPILVRMHRNVNNSLDRLKKFIFTEWKFYNTHQIELYDSLSELDKKLFSLDIKPMVWEDYFSDLTQGVRTYLNNESPKTLPKAHSKDKILLVAHLGLQAALLALVWWLVRTIFASTWFKTGLIVSLTYILFDQL